MLRAVRRTDQHHQLGTVESGLDIMTGVGDLGEAFNLAGGVDPACGSDLRHVVGEVRSVEEPHGVAVESEVEGGRETTIARARDGDVRVGHCRPRVRLQPVCRSATDRVLAQQDCQTLRAENSSTATPSPRRWSALAGAATPSLSGPEL